MNIKHLKTITVRSMYILVILVVLMSVSTVANAAPASPFVGKWEAVDVDGSDMSLAIGGPPTGPFQITWTDNYIDFCNGEAGIVRGTGWLNEGDSNLLEADVHLECFTTGETLDFHVTFRYHPDTNTLSVKYSFGQVTIWHRPGGGQAEEPPALGLRVNYGHDWVESFYEGGHTAWITVTDGDGNLKATAELVTEPKWYWGDETGFQSLDGVWFDADGNQMDYPPDIQPYDWVYGWVDNGASAQVQIGEISGTIDLNADSIGGTVNAPWFSDPVPVECLDWGSGQEPPFDNKDGGFIPTNGEDPYSCSWYGEWDIQPGQNVGVGYFGPDGHWVANAFYVRPLVLYIHYEYPDVVEGDYELGHSVQVIVFDSEWNTKATATVNTMEMPHWGGAPGFRVEQWDGIEGPPDIQPGDVVRAVVDDGFLTTEARVGEIAGVIDLDTNSVTGTINAPWAGELVNVLCMPWGAPEGASDKETTVIPDGIGEFTCSWDSDWDIQPGETVGIAYWGNDLHWVANAISNPWIMAFPEANQVFGYGWPIGSDVNLIVNGTDIATVTVGGAPWDANDIMAYFDFGGMHDLVAGDEVTLSGSGMERTHLVQNLAITEVNMETDTVSGIADSGDTVHAWVHGFGQDVWLTIEDGTWSAYFGSDEFQLEPGMCGRAEIRVEGNNSTNVDWCIPRPWLNAFPEWDIIYSYEWPANSDVDLIINGQFVQTVTVGPTSWDPNVYTAYFEFGGLYDLKPGDVITLSGSGMQVTYTVQNLTVTAVDETEDTISGTADPNAGIFVFPHATWQQLWVTADSEGNWMVDFTGVFDWVPGECGRAEIRDGLNNSTAVDWCIPESPPVPRTLEAGNFYVMWSETNPEEVTYLSWKGSANLASSCTAPNCPGNFEFFGNSWVSENEGTPDFFFASLVGGGTTGSWTQAGTTVDIHSVCLGCWNSADTAVHTSYQFFDDPSKADLIAITRTFEFGETPFAHAIRVFIPRLYPFDGFSQVVYPDVDGNLVVAEAICDFGCQVTGWYGSWFAIHNPATGQGVILQRAPSTITPALWLDWDAASFTNASNFLLLHPDGGFTGTVTETEYLCFYDSDTWTPSLTLPGGCQP